MSEKGTEQATEQRKQKARDKGDIVHSRELISALAMLVGVLVAGQLASQFMVRWAKAFAHNIALGTQNLGAATLLQDATRSLLPALFPVVAILTSTFGAALVIGLGLTGGVQIHPEALEPQLNRLNPIANLKNMLTLRSVSRLMKSMIPAGVTAALGVNALKTLVLPMPIMSINRVPVSLGACLRLATYAAWIMLTWALFDYVLERRAWNRKLRMTKQELRDELKETMGDPQVKGRIRRIQNAMRRRRIKADVSKASVVITNPTHYAVALEFSFESMAAPTVLLKGRNLHAQRIREEAQWAGVPIVENPPLARSLFKTVEEGHSIPYELYAAVAGILAFLYRQKVEEATRAAKRAEQRAVPKGQDTPTERGVL